MKVPSPIIALLSGVTLVGSSAWGKQDRFQVEYPVRKIAITETEAELGMDYNYYGETITREGGGRTRYSNHYMREYIIGRTRGYVYHPRFIDFSASIQPGLTQQSLHYSNPRTGDTDSTSNDALLGYSFRADILKENRLNGTISSRRNEEMLMGLFIDRYRVLTESHSGTLRWRSGGLLMDLTGTHTETEETGFRSFGTTTSDSLLYNLRHDHGWMSRTDLRYRLQAYERDFTARTDRGETHRESENVTNDLNVTNRFRFDQDDRMTLRSNFRYNKRDGEQDVQSYFLEEVLRYNASTLARPYLKGSVRRTEYEDRESDVYRGEAGFDGDLYRSLSYHFDVHGTRSEHTAYDEDRVGITGRVNYRKNTGVGVLTAGHSRTIDQVERTGISSLVQIFDEPMTVNTAFPTFLSQQDVVSASIRVTDTVNEVVYTEGFDYEVVVQGSRVGIRVLPGGILPDNSSVLIDYRTVGDSDHSYIGQEEEYHVRHDFTPIVKDLSLYGRRHAFTLLDSDPLDGEDVLEYSTDTIGLRQGWKMFAFTSEYEQYNDDFSAYDRWRNQIEGNHNVGRQIRMGWHAGVDYTDYETDFDTNSSDNWERHAYAGTHIDGTFARTGFWRVQGSVMENTGRTERATKGIIATVGYKWRRITLEGGGRFENYESPQNEQDRVQAFVGIKFNLHRRYTPKAGS